MRMAECTKCGSMATEYMEAAAFEGSAYACERYKCRDCGHDFGVILKE